MRFEYMKLNLNLHVFLSSSEKSWVGGYVMAKFSISPKVLKEMFIMKIKCKSSSRMEEIQLLDQYATQSHHSAKVSGGTRNF